MSNFHRSLSRFHRRWCIGRAMVALLAMITLLAAGFLLHGWADYKLALSSGAREAVNAALIATLCLATVISLVVALRRPREAVAAMLDERRADPRRRILAASSLETQEAETTMQRFHLDRALDDAARELGRVPAKHRMPFPAIGKALGGLLLVAGLIAGLQHWAAEPFRVVSNRIFDPAADIPPYSPLRFEITPGDLASVYGGEAVAKVTISGGEVTADVRCLIRDPRTGAIEPTTAYRESPTQYAHKFTNTLQSHEFAFATGRARSAWHTLDVLLQPKVSGATVTVQPPAYTGRDAESYPLDSGEIKALEGSTVTLEVHSNRPLSGGDLTATPMNTVSDTVPAEVPGESAGPNSVRFSWAVHASSEIAATIRDVRSTPSDKPLNLKLTVIPDQAPVVDLTSPEQLVLATPDTKLPFVADVEDDHGLAKVSMVRALVGFRDRNRVLADSLARKKFDFREPLKLGELGVEVGQILEFYLEAMDRNPTLLGRGVSEVVRVRIISEEDYAERIRAQFELDAFTARYRALAQAIQDARKALQELDEAADLGLKEEFEKARKNAETAHAKAGELAQKLADDFQAFAMEKRLTDLATDAAGKLGANQKALPKLDFNSGEATTRRAIAEMQERLGGTQKQSEELRIDAETAQKVGRVMEMAAEFKRIKATQESLVQRLDTISEEIRRGITTNATLLDNLGRQQENNREALLDLARNLKERADALPPGFEQMQADVAEFLALLEQLEIPNPMQTAAEAAGKGKSTDAFTNAMLALSLMEKLINQPDNGF